MKCALEMVTSTANDRATVAERKEAEAERLREAQRLAHKAILDPIVEDILAKFEAAFRNYDGNTLKFTYEYCGKYHTYWCNEDEKIYRIVRHQQSRYMNDRPDYDIEQLDIRLSEIVEALDKLCYNCQIMTNAEANNHSHCYWYSSYGQGERGYYTLPLRISINPECLKEINN